MPTYPSRSIFVFIAFIFLILLGINSCSHSVDSPPDIPQNGPRTYSWTIDTLIYDGGQTIMNSIWGANDSLVYAVGHNSSWGKGAMWKYDGKTWTRVHLFTSDGGTISPHPISGGPYNQGCILWGINGFAANDIYAFGTWDIYLSTGEWMHSAFGLHFDGFQWQEIPLPKEGTGVISSVGTSPTSMYCSGYDGMLYHFNGAIWTVDTVKSTPYPELPFDVVKVIGTTRIGGVYVRTEQVELKRNLFYTQILKIENNKCSVVDSATNRVPWGGAMYWQSKEGKIYSCGYGGVFCLSNDKWQCVRSGSSYSSVFGANDQHMFAVGDEGVFFYDGRSWTPLGVRITHNMQVNVAWCTVNQVFIVCSDGWRTYIIHGK
jgi:hypothetical protein